MPLRNTINMLPFLNIMAVAFTLVAEIIKAYVRHQNGNGNGHA